MNSGAYSTPTKQKTSASPPSSATISGSDSGDGNCSTGSNRRSSRSPAMGSNDTHSNSNSDRSNNELRQKVERFVMKKKLTSERKKQLESEKKYEGNSHTHVLIYYLIISPYWCITHNYIITYAHTVYT